MKQFNLKSAQAAKPVDVVGAINTGIQIVEAAAPVLKTLFDKINEFLANIGKNKPNSPAGRLARIEALEAQNKLQKEQNKLFEQRLAALEGKA